MGRRAYLSCFLVLGCVIHLVLAAKYAPTNKMLLNAKAVDDDCRTWMGNIRSKFATVARGNPTTPYTTTRTFRSEFRSNFARADRNLAGRLPLPAAKEDIRDPSSKGNSTRWVIGGAVCGTVLVAIFGVAVCYWCSRRRKRRVSHSRPGSFSDYTRFAFPEIVAATHGFDDAWVIGDGGFGKVYRGTFNHGTTSVAIKRRNGRSNQGEKEFRAEIAMLSKLRHHNLISLIGDCSENCEMILVYEYMDKGTLRSHLYNNNHHHQHLMWNQRLQICIDAARGLHYLHTGGNRPIIHRDVKTTNILLDENFVAKMSDFGMSRPCPPADRTELSSDVKGSYGYWDPEYVLQHKLTEKSDVYSFGVVLFEVICARRALDNTLPQEQALLAEWALHCYSNNILDQIMDPYLNGKISPQCLEKYVETAVRCLNPNGTTRPSMGDVLRNLELCLKLQVTASQ